MTWLPKAKIVVKSARANDAEKNAEDAENSVDETGEKTEETRKERKRDAVISAQEQINTEADEDADAEESATQKEQKRTAKDIILQNGVWL